MPQLEKAGHARLTVGDLAARSGVSVSALHFYERKGLLAAERDDRNQRRYRRDALRRVTFIRVAQRVGIPLAEVREALAALPSQRTPTKADWATLSRRWRAALDARIADLEHLRNDLDGCIGCGCLSLRTCRLNNPDDVLGATGTGPRRWDDSPDAR